ncbi:Nucleolar protein 9 [Myotisia sp. PD_48]|nr:Nucleolar protein 9 [Myotisia sp. PD_48]
MPREKQKRGRRAAASAENAESKRKREDEEIDQDLSKRQRISSQEEVQHDNGLGNDYIPFEGQNYAHTDDTPFYGLLDTEEQEYFSKVSLALELNQFQDEDDKIRFIESIYTEASGKELKLACSQSCSRLMEKLITISTADQVKSLFQKFAGHFDHLVQHRFASHCCECLLIRATPIITQEMRHSKGKKPRTNDTGIKGGNTEIDGEADDQPTVTELLLGVISELEGNWGYLLTEAFASHTIRVLLLILAGEPIADQTNSKLLASRKKENVGALSTSQVEQSIQEKREVPPVFTHTLNKMIKDLTNGLNTANLQTLAGHSIGSPVLQVILSLELSLMPKETLQDPESVFRRLIPAESLESTESSSFISTLFYHNIGSRLLEVIVRTAPGKVFKQLYKSVIRDRIGSLSRNEIASYVVIRVLERVSKEDLQSAMESIIPEIPSLVERYRLNVIKTLIDRARVREADTTLLAKAIRSTYGEDDALLLKKLLAFDLESQDAPDDAAKPKNGPSPQQLHGSLVAQAMLQASGDLAKLVESGLLAAQPDTIIALAKQPTASRAVQESLTCSKSNVQFRRRFIPKFYGRMAELAIDSSGSHVVDSLWKGTSDLMFMKQRLAEELSSNESAMRDSYLGRAIWRNWSMDLYRRKRGEWVSRAKCIEPSGDSNATQTKPKSKLDIARDKFAARAELNNKRSKPELGNAQQPQLGLMQK